MKRATALGAMTVIVALITAQTAAASWQQQPTPFPSGAQTWGLSGVACTPQNTCEAVGSTANSGGTHLLAEGRSGQTWTIQSITDPAGSNASRLAGVSCRSATSCIAVGDYGSGGNVVSLAEQWNGSSWSMQSTPNPVGATDTELRRVACGSLTACIAVGDSKSGVTPTALAEDWNGTSWSILSVPIPADATQSELFDVSCTSATACVAVGSYSNASGTLTLAEAWNGSSWSIQSTPNPASSTFSQLEGVSCTTASACTAVGSGLAERWNGASWSLQTIVKPRGTTEADLTGVSCKTATACVAVGGHYDIEAVQQLAVEAWDGTRWKLQDAPISTSSDSSLLYDVFCSGATACTAVGTYHDPTTGDRALVELDALRWQLQDAAQPFGSIGGSLDSVSCKFADSCQAVGTFETVSDFESVAEGFHIDTWAIETTPDPSISNLSGVSCTSRIACTAVGDFSTGGSNLAPLAERWNGTSWATQSTPSPAGATRTFLIGVSCTSATSCMAVGFYVNNSGAELPLAEQWNGSVWAIRATPNPSGSTTSRVDAVSCTSASACVAVGHFSAANGMFAEVWDGATWTLQTPTVPNGGSSPSLGSVSCTSASACSAVGQYFNGSQQVPLAERFNGTSWTVQSVPPPAGATLSGLKGVSCSTATGCSAVGWSRKGANPYKPLAERWNGTSWVVLATPTPFGSQGSFLNAVSCPSAIDCTAVGYFTDNSHADELLAEQLS